MTQADWATALGSVRENIRAIVQGDAGVFSRGWITGDPADLVLEKSGTTAKGRLTASVTSGNQDLWLASNASQNAGGATWSRDDTGKVAWRAGLSASGDKFVISRAAAAANPITWTDRLHITSVGEIISFASSAAPYFLSTENGAIWQARNSAGTYENVFWGRHTDNVTYLNYGSAGFQLRTNAAAVTLGADASQQVRIGAATPSTRLHVGVGGTGAAVEEIRIDYGTGGSNYGALAFRANGTLKGDLGVAGSNGPGVAGSLTGDMWLRNGQRIILSTDGGTTLHASLDASGYWRAKSLIATAVAPTAASGEIAYGATTATTVGAAGGAAAPPATPDGYVIINVAGTQKKIPYYAT